MNVWTWRNGGNVARRSRITGGRFSASRHGGGLALFGICWRRGDDIRYIVQYWKISSSYVYCHEKEYFPDSAFTTVSRLLILMVQAGSFARKTSHLGAALEDNKKAASDINAINNEQRKNSRTADGAGRWRRRNIKIMTASISTNKTDGRRGASHNKDSISIFNIYQHVSWEKIWNISRIAAKRRNRIAKRRKKLKKAEAIYGSMKTEEGRRRASQLMASVAKKRKGWRRRRNEKDDWKLA